MGCFCIALFCCCLCLRCFFYPRVFVILFWLSAPSSPGFATSSLSFISAGLIPPTSSFTPPPFTQHSPITILSTLPPLLVLRRFLFVPTHHSLPPPLLAAVSSSPAGQPPSEPSFCQLYLPPPSPAHSVTFPPAALSLAFTIAACIRPLLFIASPSPTHTPLRTTLPLGSSADFFHALSAPSPTLPHFRRLAYPSTLLTPSRSVLRAAYFCGPFQYVSRPPWRPSPSWARRLLLPRASYVEPHSPLFFRILELPSSFTPDPPSPAHSFFLTSPSLPFPWLHCVVRCCSHVFVGPLYVAPLAA